MKCVPPGWWWSEWLLWWLWWSEWWLAWLKLSEWWLAWLCVWVSRGEVFAAEGSEAEAGRTFDIFPLAMTYTVQKSGAPFDTLLGMSVLNLLWEKIEKIRMLFLLYLKILHIIISLSSKSIVLEFWYWSTSYQSLIVKSHLSQKLKQIGNRRFNHLN